MSIQSQLNDLINLVNKRYPHRDQIETEPGAESKDLAPLSDYFERMAPQLIELLGCRNGDSLSLLFYPFRLISASEIINETELYFDTYDDESLVWVDSLGLCDTTNGWKRGWIPFAELNGQPLFIDMAPGPNGTRGQVVFAHLHCKLGVQAHSLSDWINSITDRVEADDSGAEYFVPLVS